MAVRGVVNYGGLKEYPGKMTPFLFFICLVGATGGFIFGYDIGIFSKIASTNNFLLKFFPSVYQQRLESGDTNCEYCLFNSPLLTLFTSSIYLAATISSFFAATVTRSLGRKWSMFIGGVSFITGSVLNGAAKSLLTLIMGRIFLGIGVGFANQSVLLYLSEMAPAKIRGMLNLTFQLMVSAGIFVANLINYWTAKMEDDWGWRLSLLLVAVPGVIFAVGSLALPDTPISLLERGHEESAKALLRKTRGTDEIEEEFQDMVIACNHSKAVTCPWKNIMQRRYRPQFTMAVLIPIFQQLTGINVIMFYAPLLFKTVGFGDQAALMSAVITGVVNLFATFASVISVDKVGRRALFIEGGIQMLVCQVVVGVLIGAKHGVSGAEEVSKGYAALVVTFICLYVSAYAWSWGALGWLIPSEIFPLEMRSVGQTVSVSVNMFMTFLSSLVFLNMLCNLKYGFLFFYAGWVIMMTTFIVRFLPETKNVSIEQMMLVWKRQRHWRKFIPDDALHAGSMLAAA